MGDSELSILEEKYGKYTFLEQKDNFRCGVILVANIMRWYGIKKWRDYRINQDFVRHTLSKILKTTRNGTHIKHIIGFLQKIKEIKVFVIGTSRDTIEEQIAKIDMYLAKGQIVILYGEKDKVTPHIFLIIDKQGDDYITNNSHGSRLYKMPPTELLEWFTYKLPDLYRIRAHKPFPFKAPAWA